MLQINFEYRFCMGKRDNPWSYTFTLFCKDVDLIQEFLPQNVFYDINFVVNFKHFG